MYNIKQEVFKTILKKKFNALVGNTCESIEELFKEDIKRDILERIVKEVLKKNAFNTMREIDEQVSMFNKGVNINVNFQRPTSK